MTERWRRVLSLDLRSLALFRIVFGVYLLANLATRLPFIGDFYTDAGILPRAAMITLSPTPWVVSLHFMSGEWWVQFGLLLAAILFACGMTLGYRTRLCVAASWLLYCSLYVRNPLVTYYADRVVIALLFWGMFVPLNGRWSLDRALQPGAPSLPVSHTSWGSQALVLQICFIYWFTAALKWQPIWHSEGSAIYYALSLDYGVRPLGHFLLGFPRFLRFLTRVTVQFEFIGPALVFSPVATDILRMLVVVAFIGFHLALALAMHLTWFSAVCAVAWLVFLPTSLWERLERRWGDAFPAVRNRFRWILNATLRAGSEGPLWRRRALSVPAPREQLGIMSNAVVLAALLLIFARNVSNHPSMNFKLPETLDRVGLLTQLNQRWAMFARFPYTDDGWYVISGVLLNGKRVDLWNGGLSSEARPADVAATYRDERWRAYLLRLWVRDFSQYRVYFGRYLCRTWNDRHQGTARVDQVQIDFMLEPTPPPGQPVPAPTKEQILRHRCFDTPPGS